MESEYSCDKCKYFYDSENNSECRRYPPVMVDKLGVGYERMYPSVPYKDDWCGEFEET